jgi:hypothetical protein
MPTRLALSLLVLVTGGCATHTTTLRSEPPGADVYVLDDEENLTPVGKTPMQLPLGYGFVGPTETFLVAQGDRAVRFKVVRGHVTPQSAGNAVASSAITAAVCAPVTVVSGATGIGSLVLFPLAWWLAPPAFCVAACAGLVVAAQPGFCLLQMWSPPDVVEVRLPEEDDGEASSVPGGLVEDVTPLSRPPLARPAPQQRGPVDGPSPMEIAF